jgi:dolichyl-phosphate beta-glucosyltransferase
MVVAAEQELHGARRGAPGGQRTGPVLSIVIPAFNESDRLPPNLHHMVRFMASDPQWLPAEIVVVDDGSHDGTGPAVAAIEPAEGIELRLCTHPHNRGKGAAVRTGFRNARGSLVLLTDADLAAPIEEVGRLGDAARGGAIAVGSRAIDRTLITNPQPWYRDIMGRTFNLVVRALGLSTISDTQCGFKLFPGDLARALAAAQQVDGFAYDVEHLVLARSWGFTAHEIGVHWRHVEASRVLAVRHSAQMLRDLIRLWWWRFTGALPPAPDGLR